MDYVTGKQERWSLRLSEMEFEVVHLHGILKISSKYCRGKNPTKMEDTDPINENILSCYSLTNWKKRGKYSRGYIPGVLLLKRRTRSRTRN